MKKIMTFTICLVIAIGSFVYGQRRSLPARESRFLTRPPGNHSLPAFETRFLTRVPGARLETSSETDELSAKKQKTGRERIEDLEEQVLALTIRVEALEQQINSISKVKNLEMIEEIRLLHNYKGLGPNVPLVTDTQARDKLIGFVRDDNMEGIISLVVNNEVLMVAEGTKVQLLSKYENLDVCLYEVKIMDGQFSGRTGWASSDWLIKPKEKNLIP